MLGDLMFVGLCRDRGWHWRVALAMLVFLAAFTYGVSQTGRADAAQAAQAFTWRLPAGYSGDPPYSGLVPETKPDAIDAGRWLLNAVVSPEWCENNATYSWSADSGPIPYMRTSRCKYTLELPAEGNYAITLTASIGTERAQDTRQVSVRGLLIFAMGDSIASGEGVPDVKGALNSQWQDRQCHRSARAAPSVAAQMLQKRMPEVPITFMSVACSGATILNGLIGPYKGIARSRGQPPLEPQVDVLNSLETRRKVNAVLISIGANDAYFSAAVKLCTKFAHVFRFRACFSSPATLGGKPYPTLSIGIARALSRLRSGYRQLHTALSGIPSEAIYLLQYYDPTHGSDGLTCPSLAGVPAASLDEAREKILEPLNEIGEEAARHFKWHYIGGISRLFDHHGYCAKGSEGWVVKARGSLASQLGLAGTLHPNEEGHRQIAKVVEAALGEGLYPSTATKPSKKRTGGVSMLKAVSMSAIAFDTNADLAAWLCFVIGAVVLVAGVVVGVVLSFAKTPKSVTAKDAVEKVQDAKSKIKTLTETAVKSAEEPATNEAAVAKASSEGAGAENSLQDLGAIVSSLPKRLRFAGLLILIGTLLISVATVQFGGHPVL